MLEVIETSRAYDDLLSLGCFIVDEADYRVASNIVDSIRATYDKLASFPRMGKVCELPTELPGLRSFTVSRYPMYKIYYQVTEHEIIIRRILHGARRHDASLFADQ